MELAAKEQLKKDGVSADQVACGLRDLADRVEQGSIEVGGVDQDDD